MNYTQNGVNEITKGNYKHAFSILEKGFFEEGETTAGCYLAQMYYDERITPRTTESLVSAMLLWYITSNEVPSSSHKLGVSLFPMSSKAKEVGLEYIKAAAKKEYPFSFCVLGVLAYNNEEYEKALCNFSKYLQINDDKKALLMYADSCCKIKTPDFEKAEQLYSICAEKFNDASAYLKLSEIYSTPSFFDRTKSFKFAEKAAELGSVEAARTVGVSYLIGNEIIKTNPNKDLAKAYKFLNYACENDDGEAAAYLGDIYFVGDFVQKDHTKALELYDKSIEKGYDEGYDRKGIFYYSLAKYEEAYANFKKLNADKPTAYSPMMFECAFHLYKNCSEKEEEVLKMAIYCEEKGQFASETPHLILGKAYYYGKYLNQDFDLAVSHLKCCLSHPEANYIIGKLAAYGEISSITPDESEAYLLKAANAGNADAMHLLGKLYKKWNFASKAVSMLMKAYSNGVKEAANDISEMYLNGDVTGRKDKKKAAEWSAKAE